MNLLPTNSLHQRALECVQKYKRSEKELIDILNELDQTKNYLNLGVSSLFRYCVELLGLSESETMRFTHVARKCQVAPVLREAINQGLLTVSKASRIVPVITPDNGEIWIQKAQTLNHREIEREVAKVNPKSIRRDVIQVRTSERSEVRISISKELELKITRVQEILGSTGLEDMLEKLVDLALKQKDPVLKASRILAKAKSASRSQSATWQRKAKNASAEPLEKFNPKTRTPIPMSVKHELYQRDNGQCGFKGCGEKKWLHLHHIQPLSMGGKNEIENLMLICSQHHRMMHTRRPNLQLRN